MTSEPRIAVAVRPASALAARPRLFAALEAAFGVRFCAHADGSQPDAIISIEEPGKLVARDELAALGAPVFAVLGADAPGAAPSPVRLSHNDGVDPRLRGVELPDQLAGASPGQPADTGIVLATARSYAAWTWSGGPTQIHRVAGSLSELAPTEVLRDRLLPKASLALIALVHFLRELRGESGVRRPPLRAAVLFDDPNLRWRSYGFIDYGTLVAHADRHGYHAAMAMVPLDTRRRRAEAVALFKSRPDKLSLVFHGNNHVKDELLEASDYASALALGAQALRRVNAFENRHGLRVDRVMTPPHGLCSASVACALSSLGFDALCAIHPEPWSEQPPPDRLVAGWEPATFAGPCAVIPRFPMHASAAEIALRAFLDQPLVLYGHHEDLAGGLEPLAEAVATVNRLGDVTWCSLGEIALSNHALRVDGATAIVQPFAGRVRVTLPEHVGLLTVAEPSDADDALRGWSAGHGPTFEFGERVTWTGDRTVEIQLHAGTEVDPLGIPAPTWSPWPTLRRAVAEARDRAMPLRARGVKRPAVRAESRAAP